MSVDIRAGMTTPTPGLVTLLQTIGGYPSVSLLMSTTPARQMLPEDATRLEGLEREAKRRLERESLPGVRQTVLAPLADLVDSASRGPTGSAVVVYASAAFGGVVHLSQPVIDRVVVDPTFATRDLVLAMHRTPRHVVLALSAHEARLFEGMGDQLRPAQVRSFPRLSAAGRAQATKGGDRRSAQQSRPEDRRAFYRDVDRALGAYLRVEPAPLVLVGTERVLGEFRQVSANLSRLAGCVSGSLVSAPTADLVPRVRVVLRDYLRSRQQEALDLIEQRAGANRVVSGIQAAWLAARTERPEMLAVEEGYFYPARLDAGGDLLSPATDVDHPDVIDDAVDALIEAVLRRGGWVALTEDGALADHSRAALTLRR